MEKYMPDMVSLAVKVGNLSGFYLGDVNAEDGPTDVISLVGKTSDGKVFRLYLTITKEVVQDGN